MDIIIRSNTSKPIYEQITSQIKAMVISGELKNGDSIPSMRALAKSLHISVLTVQKAYDKSLYSEHMRTFSGTDLSKPLWEKAALSVPKTKISIRKNSSGAPRNISWLLPKSGVPATFL